MGHSSIKKNALLVMALTLVSSVLGFGRESYIAYAFGASKFTDAYYVAFVVPDIIAGWLGYALTNALIPELKREYGTSRPSGIRLINTTFYIVLGGSAVLMLAAFLFRNAIIHVLAPTFTPEQQALAVHLLSIMVLAIVFSALSGLFGGINNSFESYLFPALVGIFFNLFFLVGLIGLKGAFGYEALAYGFLAGVIGRFAIQIAPLIKSRSLTFRMEKQLHPKVPIVFIAMIPIFLSQGVSQINQIMDRVLASGLPEGQISNLNYASKLGLLPIGLVGSSIAVTAYTRFVSFHIAETPEKGEALLNKAMMWIMLAALFIGGGFIFFGDTLISLFYYHGAFTMKDVTATSEIIRIYGIFSVFYMMLPVVSQYYFAQKGGKYLLMSSSIAVTFNIACGFLLVNRFGAPGLATASGLAQMVNVAILYTMAVRKVRSSLLLNLKRAGRVVAPFAVVILAGYIGVANLWAMPEYKDKWLLLVRGAGALAVSGSLVLAYAAAKPGGEISGLLMSIMRSIKVLPLRNRVKEKM